MDVTNHLADGWPVLTWRPGPGWRMIASTVAGGGIGPRSWVLNAQVPGSYARLDPAAHLAEIAAACGLSGPGVGMLTAAQVDRRTRADSDGVHVVATVGLGEPTWAAGPGSEAVPSPRPGTINLIAAIPAALTDAALVNTVSTATEAKTQALLEAGFACTGTASDAICVAVRETGAPAPFGGPRSPWGGRLARAVHAAVLDGALAWRRDHDPARPTAEFCGATGHSADHR